MQKLVNFASSLGLVTVLVFLQLVVLSILPFPFNQLKLPLAMLLWFLAVVGSRGVLLLSLASGFLLELFSVTPFGFGIMALSAAIIVVQFLLSRVFTNRSVPIIFLNSFIGVFMYTMVLFVCLAVYAWITARASWLGLIFFKNAVWSIFLTALITTLFYAISMLFVRRLNPRFVSRQTRLL